MEGGGEEEQKKWPKKIISRVFSPEPNITFEAEETKKIQHWKI